MGAENQYANVIAQIGGEYVHVEAVMSNPATDPHEFEASTSVAREIASAQLIVQNGVGYDTFMQQLESASPSALARSSPSRRCSVLRRRRRILISGTRPTTMLAVAKVVAHDSGRDRARARVVLQERLVSFDVVDADAHEGDSGVSRQVRG